MSLKKKSENICRPKFLSTEEEKIQTGFPSEKYKLSETLRNYFRHNGKFDKLTVVLKKKGLKR